MKDIKWVRIADGVDDCRKAAREVLREGSDVVKIMTSGGVYSMRDPPHTAQYTVDEIKAMTEEAHRVDKRVMTHCISAEGAKNSILGGVDTIEHGYLIDDEAIDMMVKHDKVLCPTLAIIDRLVTYGKQLKAPEWAQVKGKEAQAKQIETVKKAHARGVKIAVSTDYGGPKEMPMGANAIELQLLTEKCGFTSMETIVAATKIGAEACGLLDQIGTLESGKLADLLVLKSDPLKDIRIFQNRGMISLVMKEGRVEANRGLKITRA
jgi:imidazolonepropionase-like amidohydrolase